MTRVHVETGSRVRACAKTRNLMQGLLAALLFAPLALIAGCSGLVSQNSSTQTAPSQTQTFSLSGAISPTTGGSGATVTLSGAANATATADSSGAFKFTGLANGTYSVVPNHTGYTFSPTSQNATVNGANVTGVNFTASAQTGSTFSISGTISPVAGGSGAAVALSGAATGTTTANSSGVYTFTGLKNGSYAVTPSRTGYTFSPSSQAATVNGANVTGINFTASATVAHSATTSWTASTSVVAGYNVYRGSVSGGPYTKINGSLISGLTFTDSTVLSSQTYFFVATAVDGSGNESVFSNEVTALIP
ncbi:MAG TPA: hypothetical protein VKQ28_18075 [Candidatus Acidoferrum sp.]|nr:hypothetical protein [Candidatus Acidoferrum sp.]